MKKIKWILSILTAVLLLFPAIGVRAEETTKTLPSGTTKATIELKVQNALTLDGEVRIEAGKKSSPENITFKSVSVACSASTEISKSENASKRVLVVGKEKPVNVTVKVNVEFEKDGTYIVALEGGKTNADGAYVDTRESSDKENKKYLAKVTVKVGDTKEENTPTPTPTLTPAPASKPTSTPVVSTPRPTPTPTPTPSPIIIETEAFETEEEKMDESLYNEMLEDAEELLGVDLNDDGDKKESGSTFDLWKILCLIVLFLGLIALGIGGYLFKKLGEGVNDEYDGAPMVDYDIEEDDE